MARRRWLDWRITERNRLQGSPALAASPPSAASAYEESFTIYLGAQLKSMHNVRVSVAAQPTDTEEEQHQSALTVHSALPAWRLQAAMALYSRDLHALLLLVPSTNPLHHVLERSGSSYTNRAKHIADFARRCEQSTELHFAALDAQLAHVGRLLPAINGARGGDCADRLQLGDIYITRHSNVADVQIAMHMVVDESLAYGKGRE